MSVDTLLDDAINDGKTTLQIDEKTRAISYSGGSLLLGVEGDIDSHRLYFELPSESVGDDITLGAATVHIYIDFINAEYTTCICEASNKLSRDGTTTFDWLLDRRVAVCDGKVEFRVRITDTATDGNVREWHTAIFSATVLDGIDVDDKTPEVVTETSSIYTLTNRMSEFESSVNTKMSEFESSINAKVETKVNEELEDFTDEILSKMDYIKYEKVDLWDNAAITNTDSAQYTVVEGQITTPGEYAIEVDITSMGSALEDEKHYYRGTHIFKGHIYTGGSSTDESSNNQFNSSVLLGGDVVLGYGPSYTDIEGISIAKLALVLKEYEGTSASTKISLFLIQSPYGTSTKYFCTGTIKNVYREVLISEVSE